MDDPMEAEELQVEVDFPEEVDSDGKWLWCKDEDIGALCVEFFC